MVHGDIGGSWTKTKDMIKDLSSTACRNDSLVNSLIWDRTRIQGNYNSICEGAATPLFCKSRYPS